MRQTRDLARVGWRGLAPFLPIGPHERPRLADSFSRLQVLQVQAAWRGAVEHPSGGPSAPGRRCWRLGRKRPSPFSNSGPTPLRSDPNLEGLKSLRCCCAKGVGHRAQLMLRARRGARENDYPVPLLRTPAPQKLSLSCPHSGGSQLPSLSTSCHVADRERISSCSARRVAKAKVLPEPPGVLTTWRRSPFYLYL